MAIEGTFQPMRFDANGKPSYEATALYVEHYSAQAKRIADLEAKLKRYSDLYEEAYGNDGWDDHMLAVAFEKIHLGGSI